MNRRSLSIALGAAIALRGSRAFAQAAGYPSRAIQMVIPWAAGGIVDSIGRTVASALAENLGGTAVVVNRDGASGMIGSQAVAAAPADGYTLAFGPTTPITNALHLQRNRAFGVESFDYLCQVFQNMFAVTVPEASPFRSLPELLDAIRTRPGGLTYGHIGIGSISHLSFANVASSLGLNAQDVPYRGEAPMLPDILAGRLDFGITSVGGMVNRPVRLLGVFSDRRHRAFPQVATVREQGFPSLQPAMNGVMAPKGLPEPVLLRLEQACREVVNSATLAASLHRLNEDVVFLDRAEFTRRTIADFAEKGALVQRLGLTPQ